VLSRAGAARLSDFVAFAGQCFGMGFDRRRNRPSPLLNSFTIVSMNARAITRASSFEQIEQQSS
jgi:hypothetical protein